MMKNDHAQSQYLPICFMIIYKNCKFTKQNVLKEMYHQLLLYLLIS